MDQVLDFHVYHPETSEELLAQECACGEFHTFIVPTARAPFVGVHNPGEETLIVRVESHNKLVRDLTIPAGWTLYLNSLELERAVLVQSSDDQYSGGTLNFMIIPPQLWEMIQRTRELAATDPFRSPEVMRERVETFLSAYLEARVPSTHLNFMDEASYAEFSTTGRAIFDAMISQIVLEALRDRVISRPVPQVPVTKDLPWWERWGWLPWNWFK